MHREIAELFMYGDLDKNSILYRLGEIFEAIDSGSYNRQQVIREVKVQLKRLLVLATDYGFDKNLWHNYIAFFLLMNENPFSLVCEKSAVSEGTVTSIVKEDFAHIRRIFLYDFSAVEQALPGIFQAVILVITLVPFLSICLLRDMMRNMSLYGS